MRLNLELSENVVRLIELERKVKSKVIASTTQEAVMKIVNEAYDNQVASDEEKLASSYWNDMFDRDIVNSNP
jgi:hypothetical protein